MVLGMWLGTLPVGWLARTHGPPLRLAIRFGVRRRFRSDLLCRGGDRQFLAAACRHLLRRPLCRRASVLPLRRRRHGERCLPAQGGVLGAGRRRVRGGDRAATRHLHQGPAAGLTSSRRAISAKSVCRVAAAAVLQFVKVPPLAAKACRRKARPLVDIVRTPRFIVAVACGVASYSIDESGDDLGAARHGRLRPFGHRRHARYPVACAGDVWAELLSPAV